MGITGLFQFLQDIGGAIKGAHIDIFEGAGSEALKATEVLSGKGKFYIPVPKSCGIASAPSNDFGLIPNHRIRK